jgi:peroxiredoxin
MKLPTVLSSLLILFIAGWACQSSSEQTTAKNNDGEINYALQASEVSPVLTGTEIPDVTVRNVEGESLQLREKVSDKPTVLVFYRGGWCPYCNRHMADLQQVEDDITAMGYQILAISADRPEKLRESANENNLDYTLLSDSPMEASKAFGLAFKVDEATVERYLQNGIDLEGDSGYDHHLLPVPAVFILNTDGIIQFQYVNPDYRTRIKSEVLLAAAEAYYPDATDTDN